MNAPIEKSFRSLTLSFSWANLQFGTPDWLLWLLRWVTGDSNIDGKLSYGFGISPGGQELMLLKKGVDAEDFVIGNVYSNVAVMVVAKVSSLAPTAVPCQACCSHVRAVLQVLHTLLDDILRTLNQKSRSKAKEKKEEAIERGVPELAPAVPPKYATPDSLCWRKVFILLLSITHQGVCQSTMVALSYPQCSAFIRIFALICFIVFPVMYATTSVITLRGAMDMSAVMPSIGNFGPFKGKARGLINPEKPLLLSLVCTHIVEQVWLLFLTQSCVSAVSLSEHDHVCCVCKALDSDNPSEHGKR